MVTEELINESFKGLGYTAINNQVEVVKNILDAFITEGKKNVVLCLDTGSGKSVIAAVVSECIRKLTGPKLPSFILMHQNSLTHQYYNSFSHNGDDRFAIIKGANNYPCKYLRKKIKNPHSTAEECQKEHMATAEIARNCGDCEFAHTRKLLNTSDNIITNYSYFFISKLWSDHLDDRDLHVFDEAHILNDAFSEHCSIYVSAKRLSDLADELADEGLAIFIPEIKILNEIRFDVLNDRISEDNYVPILNRLSDSYKRIYAEFESLGEEAENLDMKVKYSKKYKKYHNLNCKIGDYFHYQYECVFDCKPREEFSVKPIFIGDMIQAFTSKYNLFMSATITQEFAEVTFKLNPEETKFVTAPPVFDKANRPIYFLGEHVLNFSNMKDKEVLKYLAKLTKKIIELHEHDNGIILTPSFKITEMMGAVINETEVFEHKRGMDTAKLIAEFRNNNSPGVLISPSLYEGLDLDGDTSRYQITIKTPFASLYDKRTEYIANNYPDVYKMMTLYKILQGIGRSVRSIDDYAISYFLDKNSYFLFNSKFNIWKDRYSVLM